MRSTVWFLVFSLMFVFSAAAQKQSVFRDSLDNAIDISDFLITKKGVLPAPMLISEPSVGYGAALSLIYFHDSYENKKSPPDLSVALGGFTENGTWMAGGVHAGFWNNDRIRYLGVLIKMNVNIDYYGTLQEPAQINFDSWLFLQQVIFRLGESNFFIGGRYNFVPMKNKLEFPIDVPDFEGLNFESTLSELSAMLVYDSRDNVMSPRKGILAQLKYLYSDTWMGGESKYGKIRSLVMGIAPATQKLLIAGKFLADSKLGDIPFYSKPFVRMRGVPYMKYQNNNVLSAEGELDWNLYKRWSLIGFGGYALTFPDYDDMNGGKNVLAGGAGFRYLLARKFGLKAGMDFAFSPDDFAFYLTIGHAWSL